MQKRRIDRPTRPRQSGSGELELLLGTIGLAVGTAWCLRKHSGPAPRRLDNRSTPAKRSSSQRLLLGGILGFFTGMMLQPAARNTVQRVVTNTSKDVSLSSQVTINRSPEQVYDYWKDFRNLPGIMSFIEKVEPRKGNLSHWVARGPVGPAIEWTAEIVDDRPGELLAWRSVEGSDIETWGTVLFKGRNDNRGTEVSVAFNFCPPDVVTAAAARFLSGLEDAVLHQNLSNLKAKLEAGEVPSGRRYNKQGPTIAGGAA